MFYNLHIQKGLCMAHHLSERRTEDLALDLLNIQGWGTNLPPKGNVVRQNEYKAFMVLETLFTGVSKSGKGDGYPDFLIVDNQTLRPKLVIETKAKINDIEEALNEACFYADACRKVGHLVIAVGIAGQDKTGIKVAVAGYYQNKWQPILYSNKPISWIPTPLDIEKLLISSDPINLAPIIPKPEILIGKAEEINGILREANIKDEYRPAYVGAMMLALWESQGEISRDSEHILKEINHYCEKAFERGEKSELAQSLRIDTANSKLADKAWVILAILEKLNVVTGSVDHDYLGQLYELFFRYTGGNTIGQYFTPRHISRFMVDICEVDKTDLVIDPTCGTGGFLISCIQRAYEILGIKYEDAVKIIKDKLIGYESEPVTAALCVANMILRGDGKSGIRKNDCFTALDFPVGQCQVALMNPPFNTDTPSQQFIERALESLENRGLLAVIIPTSLLVKKDIGQWREKILESNSLEAVCQLPDELFQPYANTTTSIVLLRKGIPHNKKRKTCFVRLRYDGFTLKKGSRVPRLDKKTDLPLALETILNKKEIPGFCGLATIDKKEEWSVGAYIPSQIPSEDELKIEIDELLRRLASFYIRYAFQVTQLRNLTNNEEIPVLSYRDILSDKRLENSKSLPSKPNTIGELFDIYYGLKELHSREGIPEGDSLIISPTEQYNGCYGWLEFQPLIAPPFITVAQTGSIGEAFVQLEPCGVNDDCLILLPKPGLQLPLPTYFIAAAIIRSEKWRFNYGRKLTPTRICEFPMSHMPNLEKWVEEKIITWQQIIEATLSIYK